MTRWYKGFSCRGKTDVVVDRLSHAIKNSHLGQFLPRVRIERGAYRREFYLFLAIESPTMGEYPPEVHSILSLSFLGTPLREPFTLENIKKMSRVGAESRIVDYVPRLSYRRPTKQPIDDFLETVDDSVEEIEKPKDILTHTQAYDRLLLWLSAKGSGSLNLLRGACQKLGLDEERNRTAHIARRLRLLGHLEFSSHGKKWSIAPTVLVKSDFQANNDQYILCGQRHPVLLQTLRKLRVLEELPQSEGHGPATLRIWTDKAENLLTSLLQVSDKLPIHNGGQVANRLARLLPSLSEWMKRLESLSNVLPHMSYLKKFTGKSFVQKPFDKKSGMYQFFDEPTDRRSRLTPPKKTLFYDAKRKRWLRGDWYGLRFLALQADGTPCPVHYEQATGGLVIAHDWRWPELYERVLVLASGGLPERHNGWLRYEGISPQTLDQLQVKLNLEVEELSYA